MKSNRLLVIACAVLFGSVVAQVSAEQTRLALVIGNADYTHVQRLQNPANDARAMAAALRRLHFTVITVINGNLRQMNQAKSRFLRELENYQVGLFYYSGHGLQYKNPNTGSADNWLVPVNADIRYSYQLASVPYEMFDASRMLSEMGATGDTQNIMILDACRNNPALPSATRSLLTRGLAVMPSVSQSLVVYATQPNATALDGTGGHSPFTGALLQYVGTPGESAVDMLTSVRSAVYRATNGGQRPYFISNLNAPFYFAPAAAATATAVASGVGSVNEPTPSLKVTPATGSIAITTASAGSLYLNGQLVNHIPAGTATLGPLGVGMVELTMHYAKGHVEREVVAVQTGTTTDVTFRYRPAPPGSRWTAHTLPSNQAWDSVTYGNGTFVVVAGGYGQSNVIATSSNGFSWTEGFLPSSQDWDSVTYGNGTFVAVAGGNALSNLVATSGDGVNWSQHTLPSSQDWQSVAYGKGTFVAVAGGYGQSDVVATSSDGVNWTEGSLPSNQYWDSVSYGNGIFIAVADGSSVVATSSDGVNWTQSTMPGRENWQSATYGNGSFIAVASGPSNAVATSSDGVNWTEGSLPSSQYWQSVTFGNGTFVAVAGGNGLSNVVATSNDGVNWTRYSLPSSQSWYSVTYGNGLFVAVADGSNIVATSP